MAKIEEQGSHEGFSRCFDGAADARETSAFGRCADGRERKRVEQVGKRAQPGAERAAGAAHLSEVRLEVRGEPLAELARVGPQEPSVCRARKGVFAHRLHGPGEEACRRHVRYITATETLPSL